jgi:hypothetical protein
MACPQAPIHAFLAETGWTWCFECREELPRLHPFTVDAIPIMASKESLAAEILELRTQIATARMLLEAETVVKSEHRD